MYKIMKEDNMKILVETSARHVHLSEKDLYVLFGENYKLTSKKELSQPGQFACTEKVKLKLNFHLPMLEK